MKVLHCVKDLISKLFYSSEELHNLGECSGKKNKLSCPECVFYTELTLTAKTKYCKIHRLQTSAALSTEKCSESEPQEGNESNAVK